MSASSPTDSLPRLEPCRECGFGVRQVSEFCPECGLRQHDPPAGLRSRLFGSPPGRSPACQRDVAKRATAARDQVQTEWARFAAQAREARARLEDARGRGRDIKALEEAVLLVEGARDSRARLTSTCRAILADIELERTDNALDLLLAGRTARFPHAPSLPSWSAPWRAATLCGHQAQVSSLRVSPNGHVLVSASKDKTLRVWDRATHACTKVVAVQGEPVSSLAFSPDGRRLATGGTDGSVRLWDTATWLPAIDLGAHAGGAFAVAFAPDGRTLASAGKDGAIRLWDAGRLTEACVLKGHKDAIMSLAFSRDGSLLASGAWDGTIKLWSVRRRGEQGSVSAHQGGVMDLSFSPDGQWLASSSWDKSIRLWNLASQREVAVLTGHRLGALCIAFSPDGKWLASGGGDHELRIWDVEAREECACLELHGNVILALAFSPDGEELFSAGGDDEIHVWQPHVAPPAVLARVGEIAGLEQDAAFVAAPGGAAAVFRAQTVFARLVRWAADRIVSEAMRRGRESRGIPETGDLAECLSALHDQLLAIKAGPTLEASLAPQRAWLADVRASLPALALRDEVRALLDGVEAQIASLANATEADCDRRLERLEALHTHAEALSTQLHAAPPTPSSQPWVEEIVDALHAVLAQIPGLIDLVLVRKTTALVATVAPIADLAPLEEIHRQQQRLRVARAHTHLDTTVPGGSSSQPLTNGRMTPADREAVIAEVVDRSAIVSSQMEALAEVDQLLRGRLDGST